ncbi:hypothetical protein PQZ09_01800 [Methylophilaceae bacterium]|nr:hypothetical protein [Methylophilaceae bacterium]|tara:strand:+ start:147 stop:398 length:252 start_codon:yes stop_codon:yes gene_type:complete
MEKNTILNQKNNKNIKNYVRGLTEDLDYMAEKMRKNDLDVEAYQQWFALITSALDLIKNKAITNSKIMKRKNKVYSEVIKISN